MSVQRLQAWRRRIKMSMSQLLPVVMTSGWQLKERDPNVSGRNEFRLQMLGLQEQDEKLEHQDGVGSKTAAPPCQTKPAEVWASNQDVSWTPL